MPQLELQPPVGDGCLLCGGTPRTEDEHNRVKPMIVAVGMDVNWGDPVQICLDCVGVMADILGRVDAEEYKRAISELGDLNNNHESLQKRHDETVARLSKILDGRRAEIAQKRAAKKKVAA